MQKSFRRKIMSGFLVMVFLCAFTAILAFITTRNMQNVFLNTMRDNVSSLKAAEELELALLSQKGFLGNYFLDGDPIWLKKLEEKKANFEDWLNKASEAALTPLEKGIIEDIKVLYKTYESERYRAKQLYESGNIKGAKNILLKDMWKAFEALYQKCEDYLRINESIIKKSEASLQKKVMGMIILITVPAFVIIGLVGSMFFLLTRRILASIEIAKLRFFLSLIVDVDVDDNRENKGIHPLPNLEFKFVCANSLIELEDPSQSGSSTDNFFSELEKLTKNFFSVSNPDGKKGLRKEIEDLINNRLKGNFSTIMNLTKAYIDNGLSNKRLKQKHEKEVNVLSYEAGLWESYLNIFKDEPVGFFNLKYFFPEVKDGFDIAIANPPYVSVKEISNGDKEIFSKLLETAKGRFNLFTLFLERAHKLLKLKGTQIFILPEGLFSNVEYRYIREYLLRNSEILLINMFSERVFEASVDTAIIALRKDVPTPKKKFPLFRDLYEKTIELSQSDFIEMPFSIFTVKFSEGNAKIFKKSYANVDFLENILEIQQGIIYSGQSKSNVFSNKCLDSKYKRILDGRDVLKWRINWTEKKENRYIQYTNKLHRPREERLFLANEKILIVRRSKKIIAAYDNEQYYALNTAYVCLLKNNSYNLKYVLAILNSTLINFLYQIMFFGWQVTIPALNFVPVKNISGQEDFAEVVDKILALSKSSDYLKSSTKQAKVKEYERQIDQMVYKLYELTPTEIELIENFNK